MAQEEKQFTQKQLLFKELVVGSLIYAVVLGFFNDYTAIVEAKSFSTIFFAAIILEILTYGAFGLKKRIVRTLKTREHTIFRVLTAFFVWLIMFSSKFVFIWALNFVFGGAIIVHGFFGILFVVVCVTIAHTLANTIFVKLGK